MIMEVPRSLFNILCIKTLKGNHLGLFLNKRIVSNHEGFGFMIVWPTRSTIHDYFFTIFKKHFKTLLFKFLNSNNFFLISI